MDWKIFGSTFALVFLAEMGDRTQIMTLTQTVGTSSRGSVFLGSALALVATSAIAVIFGEAFLRLVPAVWLKRAAGVLCIALGIFFLLARGEQTG